MIELHQVKKSFGDFEALKNIELFVQEGEIFGIIGKSGAGKSTLLKVFNLLERPDSGEVFIDNQNLMKLSKHDLRKARHKIGMIFQHFYLANSKTVEENIALPLVIQKYPKQQIEEKVRELLALVELEDKQQAYPSELSGGQKQRVAIARALATSPKILLCDEATSALDPETTHTILALLKKINQLLGITIVLITHEMNVIKQICGRLAVMSHGRLVENMPLKDVFQAENSLARKEFYRELSPKLPDCLKDNLTPTQSTRLILKLFFQSDAETYPFITQTSRELHLDINILLANIDKFDTVTCGVLIVEVHAKPDLQEEFIARCQKAALFVEKIGYVME